MRIFQVSPDTCIFVNPKAGSMSMQDAIGVLGELKNLEITPQAALLLDKRVVFIRHPIERMNSLFNMFYWLSLNHASYSEFMPRGTIRADGQRVRGGLGKNEHHFTAEKISEYQARLAAKRGEGEISDDDLARWLDNRDYHAFVDYILAGNTDDHWTNQVDLCTYNDAFIPNIAHRFDNTDNIRTKWALYVGGTFPEKNSWQAVDHEVYKLTELQAYYAKDIQMWGMIDGDWYAS